MTISAEELQCRLFDYVLWSYKLPDHLIPYGRGNRPREMGWTYLHYDVWHPDRPLPNLRFLDPSTGLNTINPALKAALMAQDTNVHTPLHFSVLYGDLNDTIRLIRAITFANEWGGEANEHGDAISTDSGPNLHVQDKLGLTALHLAAQEGDASVIQALLCGGARLDLVCNRNLKASGHVIRTDVAEELQKEAAEGLQTEAAEKPGTKAIKKLRAKVVKMLPTKVVEKRREEEERKLQTEEDENLRTELVEKLRMCEDRPLRRNDNGNVVLDHPFPQGFELAQWLVDEWLPLDTYDSNGMAALRLAAQAGDKSFVEKLDAHGATMNLKSEYGRTSLHYAAQNGNPIMVASLLSRTRQTNAQDRDGMTALHLAAIGGHSAAARLLLEHGVDNTLQANNGLSAAYAADKNQHHELAQYIGAFDSHRAYIPKEQTCNQ